MKNFTLCAFADEADDALLGQVKALTENGISNLEIRNVDGVNVSDLSVKQAKEIKNVLDENGIKVFSIGSPIGKIDIEDDFAPHLEKFKKTLEIADVLGAKAFRLFSFYIDKNKRAEDFKNKVISQLGEFVKANENSGVVLCHENEKGIFGDVASRCVEIHKALPSLKAVFDPANFVQCGEDTVKAWEQLSPYIHYMHIKDAAANGDIVPAGTGIGQIPELLKRYREMGGTAITLEPHLSEFAGLSGLERAGEKSQVGGLNFASQEEAFAAGVASLKAIL